MRRNPQASLSLRDTFLSALRLGDIFQAVRAIRALLQEHHGTRQCSFIRRAVEKIADGRLPLKPLRVALLSSFSIDFIHDALVAYGFLNGLRIDIYQAGFSQFRQEILNSESGLYAFSPDVVILAVEGKDWIPAAYHHYLNSTETELEATISKSQDELTMLIRTFQNYTKATLLVHNFSPPVWRHLGILDGHIGMGQAQLIHKLNDVLYTICRDTVGAYVVDYAGLITKFGALHWYDERLKHYAKAPIAQAMLGYLAAEYMKFFRGHTGQTKKCLVVDLDNTLWGGVLGEEGISGIQLGPEYPGSAFIEFQEAILNLHNRGVLLAIASKNNPTDVDEVFAIQPYMVLKKEHFADIQIHWKPKSESLVEIANRLNIGLEHMVLVDDSPVECEQITRTLPMVTTILLPKQPEAFVQALLEEGLFDGLHFSPEDRRRGDLYRQREQAEALRSHNDSLEDFYRDLAMEVIFAPVQEASLARAAQLTQKTNQFNVTTMRYTASELSEWMADPGRLLTTVRVRDHFGDNGIVGLIIAHTKADELEINTFLLSCRVIGRTVETAMLAYLCDEAMRCGMKHIRGQVIPTAKNMPARDLFERHGFQKLTVPESEATSWILHVDNSVVRWPEWFKIVIESVSNE
jgi:FkbH-like protein